LKGFAGSFFIAAIGGGGGGGGGFTSCIISFCFKFGVSGNLGIILSLELKYDGCSLGGSTVVIFVLLRLIVSFNIFDVMKDDNKLLLYKAIKCGLAYKTTTGQFRFEGSDAIYTYKEMYTYLAKLREEKGDEYLKIEALIKQNYK
jgi:hypothetical protein